VADLTPDTLRAWREQEGLTQAAAAEIAGVATRTWQRWEAGEREIHPWLRDVLAHRHGSAPGS
jgi:transcriptional regulator with XRE-family HTH domain